MTKETHTTFNNWLCSNDGRAQDFRYYLRDQLPGKPADEVTTKFFSEHAYNAGFQQGVQFAIDSLQKCRG